MRGANPRLSLAAGFLVHGLAATPLKIFPKNKKALFGGAMNIHEAVRTVRDELLKHEDLYYGFLASIESSLSENLDITNIHEIAVDVLDRVMGDDRC